MGPGLGPHDITDLFFSLFQAITADGGVIELGATVFYRVKDALASVLKVQDFNKALRNLAHSVVHRLVNKHQFQAIEKDRKILRDELQVRYSLGPYSVVLVWSSLSGRTEQGRFRLGHGGRQRGNVRFAHHPPTGTAGK